MNNVILVDTEALQNYAERLKKINSRLSRLDWEINGLYFYASMNDLYWLRKSDRLIGYKYSLKADAYYLEKTAISISRCEQKLLKQDPIAFKKPAESLGEKIVADAHEYGVAKRKRIEEIERRVIVFSAKLDKAVGAIVTPLAENYYSKGKVYQYVQYGKAVLKAAKGIGKIAAGVGSMIGTGGMSTPVALLSIISGCNDVYNAAMDGAAAYVQDYDNIGNNFLKEKMSDGFGIIGESFGYREAGEKVGEVMYYGIDLVTSIESMNTVLEKVPKKSGFNPRKAIEELKEIGNYDAKPFLQAKVGDLGDMAKAIGNTHMNAKNAIKVTGYSYKVLDKGLGVFKAASKIVGFENPAIEAWGKISKPIGTAGKVSKLWLA